MAETLLFEIVTPERLAFSEEVEEVVVPGTLGELGILPGHVPFLSTLQPGVMMVRQDGREIYYAVSGGFIEVHEDHVILLAETAERADEIDLERALASKAKAEEILKDVQDASELKFKRADLRLKRALTREEVARRSRS